MNVKFVINKCIDLLEVEYTTEELLRCFNLVETEMATDYFPLYKIQYVNSKKVYYAELDYHPIRIISCNCKFKLYKEYMESKDVIKEVIYSYAPDDKGCYDECAYGFEFLNCYIYGIMSEFLISQGFFEESIRWINKYHDAIKSLAQEEMV